MEQDASLDVKQELKLDGLVQEDLTLQQLLVVEYVEMGSEQQMKIAMMEQI